MTKAKPVICVVDNAHLETGSRGAQRIRCEYEPARGHWNEDTKQFEDNPNAEITNLDPDVIRGAFYIGVEAAERFCAGTPIAIVVMRVDEIVEQSEVMGLLGQHATQLVRINTQMQGESFRALATVTEQLRAENQKLCEENQKLRDEMTILRQHLAKIS